MLPHTAMHCNTLPLYHPDAHYFAERALGLCFIKQGVQKWGRISFERTLSRFVGVLVVLTGGEGLLYELTII